jgi:hypothetical protein
MPVLLSPFLSGTISLPIRWQRLFHGVRARLESAQHRLDFQITADDQLLIGPLQFPRLFEGEQMLWPPVAHQGFANGLRLDFDVWIPQLG